MRKLLLLLSVGMFIGLTSCSKEEDLGKEKIEDKVVDKEAVAAQIESDRVLKTLKAHEWQGDYTELSLDGNLMKVGRGSATSVSTTYWYYRLKPKPVGEGNIYCYTEGDTKIDKVFKYSLNPEGTILTINIEGQEFKLRIIKV